MRSAATSPDLDKLTGSVRFYLRITEARLLSVQRYFRERHVEYPAR
jgi:hypothetical protein